MAPPLRRALLAAAGLVLAACSGGGGDGDEDGGFPATTAAGAGAAFGGYCGVATAIEAQPPPLAMYQAVGQEQRRAAVNFIGGLLPEAKEAEAAAPEEIADDVAVIVATIEEVAGTGDLGAFSRPEVVAASERTHAFELENCGWRRVDVTMSEYAYGGLPAAARTGVVSFELRNSGSELHELVLVRIARGVDEPLAELLAAGEERFFREAAVLDLVTVEAGGRAYAVAELAPGRYGAVCFVPVGGVERAPRHWERGMLAEFVVG